MNPQVPMGTSYFGFRASPFRDLHEAKAPVMQVAKGPARSTKWKCHATVAYHGIPWHTMAYHHGIPWPLVLLVVNWLSNPIAQLAVGSIMGFAWPQAAADKDLRNDGSVTTVSQSESGI